MRLGGPGLLFVAAALLPSAARAQASPRAPSSSGASVPLAESLYQKAKALMAAGRYAEACEGFAESNRIDPATGGTLLNLAVCHEKLGKVATAAAEFEEARALARHYKRPDREQFAAKHLAALRSRIPTLSFSVHEAVDGEEVSLDGVAVAKVAWTGVPVDPGEHAITAGAPGKVSFRATVTVGADGASRAVEVPALADVPPPPTPPASIAASGPDGAAGAPGSRILGFALGGLGLAGLGVGAAFGVGAIGQNSASLAACPGGRCTTAGAADSRYALTDANVANVCIGAGIVAVGVATVLVLTSSGKSASARTAEVVARLGGSLAKSSTVGLGGTF